MAKAYEIAEYREKLKKHDWTYEYSDSHEVWRRGQAERRELVNLQLRLDPKGEIWNSIAEPEFQLRGK